MFVPVYDTPPSRSLKVREVGDFWANKTKPVLMLSGNWLKNAGFSPNSRAKITVTGPGKLTITLEEQEEVQP